MKMDIFTQIQLMEPNWENPFKFTKFHTIVRLYRDVFLLFDSKDHFELFGENNCSVIAITIFVNPLDDNAISERLEQTYII
eukprot:gnl/Chilomastix_caulleri/6430.p1 GENE.gnl/Chilomastix_caulleri/6430~~gnl/Chilomastix_caulleri/6430.p1  ORF type:complete len:81 (+),score=10.43 gnl/Chilomastix_caulleri/6430:88-330(+)